MSSIQQLQAVSERVFAGEQVLVGFPDPLLTNVELVSIASDYRMRTGLFKLGTRPLHLLVAGGFTPWPDGPKGWVTDGRKVLYRWSPVHQQTETRCLTGLATAILKRSPTPWSDSDVILLAGELALHSRAAAEMKTLREAQDIQPHVMSWLLKVQLCAAWAFTSAA